MKKFTETIADDDYRNSDGLLVCGRCGTPKEMRLSTELLGGHTAIVPIPCECMKRAEAERRGHPAHGGHRHAHARGGQRGA